MGNLKTGVIQFVLWLFFTLFGGFILTKVLLYYNIADPFAFKFDNIFDYLGSFFMILEDLNDILALRDGEFIAGLDVVLMAAFLGASVAGMICMIFGIGDEMETVRNIILGIADYLGSLVGIFVFIGLFLVVGAIMGWFLPVFAIIHILIGIIRKD